MIRAQVPRNDGTYTTLRTDVNYDPNGNVLDVCVPREFLEGASTICTATGVYSRHWTFDPSDRAVLLSTYRSSGSAANQITYAYDADGNPITQNNPNGGVITRGYDLLDRKNSQTVRRDSTTQATTNWIYDPTGNVTAQIQPATSTTTRVTAYSFDVANRPVDTVAGATNQNAGLAGLVDANGGINIRTRVAYDADGNVVARFLPSAFATSTTTPDPTFMVRIDYDADGRKLAQWVPRYDNSTHADVGLGSTTQSTQCPGNAAPQPVAGVPAYPTTVGVCVTRSSYDYAGNRTKVILATSNGTDNRYLAYNYTDDRLVATISAPSPVTAGARVTSLTSLYDADGQLVKSIDPLGIQGTRSYTSDGLVSQITNPPNGTLTHLQTFTYDGNGNQTTGMPVAGQKWTYTYYADNLRKTAADPAGDTTQYTYDQVGNPIQVYSPSATARDANNTSGTPTTNAYMLDGLLSSVTVPVSPNGAQTRLTTYGYDLGGRKVTQSVSFNGGAATTQQFAYFPDDRIQTQTGRNNETITSGYDPAGNLATVSDSTSGSTVTSTYYLDGRPRTTDDGSWTSKSAYDGSGNRSVRADVVDVGSTTYTTTYAYNDAELLATTSSNMLGSLYFNQGIVSIPYTYDAAGRVKTATMWGQVTTWTWNPDNTLAERIIPPAPTLTAPLTDWTYTYDSSYSVLHAGFKGVDLYNPSGPALTRNLDYVYDSAGRVSSYNDGSGFKAATYDHDNNRLTYGTQSFNYNADDSTAKTGYTYLVFGGLQTDGCSNYTYDGFDRLRAAASTNATGCPSLQPVTYAYDGLDRQKTISTTVTVPIHYDGLTQIASLEKDVYNQDLPFVLGPKGDRVAMHFWCPPGCLPAGFDNAQLLEGDGRGNVSTVWEQTESGPSVACEIFFDPWGIPAAPGTSSSPCLEGSTNNRYFYHGARLDNSTGNYQLGSRTYDPTKAAFLMPDTYRASQPASDVSVGVDPLTRNRYAYVNGDPVNMIDPTGHDGCSWNPLSWGTCAQQAVTKVTSAVTSAATTVASAVNSAANTVTSAVASAANAVGGAIENYISSQFDQISAEISALYAALNATINALDSIVVPTLQTVLGSDATDTGSNDPLSQIQRAARHEVSGAAKTGAVLVDQARPAAVAALQTTADQVTASVNSCQGARQSAGNALNCAVAGVTIASMIVMPEGGAAADATINSGRIVVYRSFDEAGHVNYVGITNDLERRAAEQLTERGISIDAIPGLKNLSREDARAVEQALINRYGLSKNGGTLVNKINSIAKSNTIYRDSVARGNELLRLVGQ